MMVVVDVVVEVNGVIAVEVAVKGRSRCRQEGAQTGGNTHVVSTARMAPLHTTSSMSGDDLNSSSRHKKSHRDTTTQ
jgi:hypothetical protein